MTKYRSGQSARHKTNQDLWTETPPEEWGENSAGGKKIDGGGGEVWEVERENKLRQNTLSTLYAS